MSYDSSSLSYSIFADPGASQSSAYLAYVRTPEMPLHLGVLLETEVIGDPLLGRQH
jgi:hypothetical protein